MSEKLLNIKVGDVVIPSFRYSIGVYNFEEGEPLIVTNVAQTYFQIHVKNKKNPSKRGLMKSFSRINYSNDFTIIPKKNRIG